MSLSDRLAKLGFTSYEAKAYLALLKHGAMTGYELARRAGIPRPNIYPVTARLAQRGIVSSVEKDGARVFTAMPAAQMLAQMSRRLQDDIDHVGRDLERWEKAEEPEAAWNLQDRTTILQRAQIAISSARRRILIGIWSNEAAALSEALEKAADRGVEIATLCMQSCENECGGCRGRLFRYPTVGSGGSRWLIVVTDDREILASQLGPGDEAKGVHSSLPVLTAVAGDYLRHAMALSEILRSAGPAFLTLLDEQALSALQGTGLATDGQSWLKKMFGTTDAA